MTIVTIAGIVAGLIATQWIPLPKWRLLAGLIPLGMLLAGADALVVPELPQYVTSPSIVWQRIVSGLLVGCGAGYFVRWFRVESTEWFRCRKAKKHAEHFVDDKTS
jgi:uncharacterized membrane protein AbrB (regulator of aidB expression)